MGVVSAGFPMVGALLIVNIIFKPRPVFLFLGGRKEGADNDEKPKDDEEAE